MSAYDKLKYNLIGQSAEIVFRTGENLYIISDAANSNPRFVIYRSI